MFDELWHFGVKGMKWGVRKDARSGKHRSKLTKAIESRKRKKAERRKINKRIKSIEKAQRKRAIETDINSLNDQELRVLNDRIRNENTYKESIRYRKTTSKGARWAASVLGKSGDKFMNKLLYLGMVSAGAAVVGKFLGPEVGKNFTKQMGENKKSNNKPKHQQ